MIMVKKRFSQIAINKKKLSLIKIFECDKK